MTRFERVIIIFAIAFVTLFVLLLTLNGCVTKPCPPSPEIAQTPMQMITQVVYKTNWLVTVGFLTCFAAVYTFFSGNGGKATPLFAAGAFLIGGTAVYAALVQALQSWVVWLEWSVPIVCITVVGIWGYNHYYRSKKIETLKFVTDYLDKDKDGKVTIEDIKTVLGVGYEKTPK
jgi:hypothetical protein